jgi:hypothetical protein
MVRVIQPVDLNSGDFTNPQTGAAGEIAIRVDAASGVGAAIVAAVTPLAGAGAPSGAPAYPKLFYVDVSTTPNQQYWWNGSSWQLLGDGAGSGADGVLTGASLVGTTLTLTRSIGAPVTLDLAGLQDGTVTGASLAAGTLTLTRSIGAPITVNLTALQDGVITSLALVGTVLTANRSVGAALTVDLATLAGAAPDGVVTGASLAGTTLTLTRSVGAPVTVNLSGLQDGTVTGAALAGTVLTLTMSVGAPVTVDLAALGGGGGADGVVTSAALAGTVLTLTRSVGAPVTVDLAALSGGGADGVITGATLNATTGILTVTRSVGAAVDIDLSALKNRDLVDSGAFPDHLNDTGDVTPAYVKLAVDTVSPCDAPAASPAEVAALTGAETVAVCVGGVPKTVALSDLPVGGATGLASPPFTLLGAVPGANFFKLGNPGSPFTAAPFYTSSFTVPADGKTYYASVSGAWFISASSSGGNDSAFLELATGDVVTVASAGQAPEIFINGVRVIRANGSSIQQNIAAHNTPTGQIFGFLPAVLEVLASSDLKSAGEYPPALPPDYNYVRAAVHVAL